MSIMFNMPFVGELKLEHTFYEYEDEPILFVCINPSGTRYLCSCAKLGEEWVAAQVAEGTLFHLMENKITIRDAMLASGIRMLITWDGEIWRMPGTTPDEMLPLEGEYLDLEEEKEGEYYHTLRQSFDHI